MDKCSYLWRRVFHFHRLIGHQSPNQVVNLDQAQRDQAAKIAAEEYAETIVALVGTFKARRMFHDAIDDVATKRGLGPGDLVEIADGVIDSQFVSAGVLVRAGVADGPLVDVVCDSNDAKAHGPVDEHGKRQRPPGWTPPAIYGELVKQGWKG